jgi:serine/threonine protein phosphatase PrpC
MGNKVSSLLECVIFGDEDEEIEVQQSVRTDMRALFAKAAEKREAERLQGLNKPRAGRTREGTVLAVARDAAAPAAPCGLRTSAGVNHEGQPKPNQDTGAFSRLPGDRTLLAVLDGHGMHGHLVSEYATDELIGSIEAALPADEPQEMVGAYLRASFLAVDERLLANDAGINSKSAGTTAIAALLTPAADAESSMQVHVACTGDSRCVLGCEAEPEAASDGEAADAGSWATRDLSKDQTPDDPEERARLEAKGCAVDPNTSRVIFKDGAAEWHLACSRTIGDHNFPREAVTAEPEVGRFDLDGTARCLILASDGVWEYMSSADAVALCQAAHPDADAAACAIVDRATEHWTAAEGEYRDDITAVVLYLPLAAAQ